MKVLFIHQNFPGQFRHIARHLAQQPDVEVRAIGRAGAPGLAEIGMWRYTPHRLAGDGIHPYARFFENAVRFGQQVLRLLMQLCAAGYRPDIILAHPAWGETLYVKQVYPHVPLIHYCEYYYHLHGADADFDPEFPLTADLAAVTESRNALQLLNLAHCDIGITPTRWQYALHPETYRPRLRVIHEGIELDGLAPDTRAELVLPNGRILRAGDPVVTYVARSLEPHRGFHRFMRALPKVLEQHPQCQVVVLGNDRINYGSAPEDAPTWREKMLCECPVDTSRVHFLGKVDYATYRRVLQVSAVHVYLSFPFILSWSLLEAMACACMIVASDTTPVREVIVDGHNGVLVDMLSPDAIVAAIIGALTAGEATRPMREQARTDAASYSRALGVAGYMQIIETCIAKAHHSA